MTRPRRRELEPLPGAQSVALVLREEVGLEVGGVELTIEEVEGLAAVALLAREHGIDARKWGGEGAAVGARPFGGAFLLYGEMSGLTVAIANCWEEEVDEAVAILLDAVDTARLARDWLPELMSWVKPLPLPKMPELLQ